MQPSVISTDDISIYAEGLDHPEGITVGPDGVVWAGGEIGQVYRVDPETHEPQQIGIAEGGFSAGIVLDANGIVYTCDPRNGGIMRFTPDGEVSRYCDGSPAGEVMAANHLAFDSKGNLYFSDSGRWKQDNGRIFRAKPGGEAEIWCDELTTLPNGVCLNPGETHLYVAMTLNPGRVSRVEILEDGSAGKVEDVVVIDGALPDGMAFDSEGNLYIVCYRPEAVYRLLAGSDEPELYVHDPEGVLLDSPSNIAFGELDGEPRLFVCNLGRWHIVSVPVPAPGHPLAYPDIAALAAAGDATGGASSS